ncbi:PREDICTED: acylamino-acid-releasing enzyme-like [Rhagoletis zephyria]|uniref:acylamino-acid-releasing enzyme-like n=1 Tax=Rhagoletis zephyria TaxID=28612 RepID=UPI00081135A1|nr:PREDICTED: acylamino-acid-releasing enzyme-like [Rhagoletis zephyria]
MEKYRGRFQVDKLKALFTKFSSKPTPTRAYLLTDKSADGKQFVPKLIKTNWQYRDTVQIKTVAFQKTYLCTSDFKFLDIGLPEELSSDITLQAFSQDGDKQVVLKSKTDPKSGKPEQFIVVYDKKKALKTIDVKSLNDQLTIIESATYSNFVLDNDLQLLAVVEVEKAKSKGKKDSPGSKDYDLDSHEYKQSWGEKLSTIFHSSIALIDLKTEKLTLIEKTGLSLIEPFFFKSAEKAHISVGCIGLQELPYKLGLIYCNNRTSFLLGSSISSDLPDGPIEPEVLYGSSGNLFLSSPRVYFDPVNGYDCKAIFLERDAGGAHNKSARLQQFCFESRKIQTILDNKQKRELINNKTEYSDYGPLFLDKMATNCFTMDGKYVLLDSETPVFTKPYAVDLKEKQLKLIKFPEGFCQILEVKNDWVIALGSSINSTPNLYLSNIANSTDLTNLTWLPIEDPASKKLPNITYETFAFPARDYQDKLVTGIFISPTDLRDSREGSCVVTGHGGPHAQLSAGYYQSVALYAELGLKVCLINYVGSTGVDEDYVNALLGKVGTNDVDDIYDSIQYVIANKNVDKEKLILSGGSHGGFLVTSISGQHPELDFLACIARNPVIDVASMSAISDIPDWTVCEADGDCNLKPLAQMYGRTPEEMANMYQVSPIAHVQKVKVPTLLLLGKEDLRVPYSQGLLYHRILKARGVETRCLIYDDVHSLAKIDVEYDCFLNMAKFMEKFIYYRS